MNCILIKLYFEGVFLSSYLSTDAELKDTTIENLTVHIIRIVLLMYGSVVSFFVLTLMSMIAYLLIINNRRSQGVGSYDSSR